MIWLYGRHACLAALKNKHRKIYKILLSSEKDKSLLPRLDGKKVDIQIVDKKKFEDLFSKDAVHQGIAVQVDPLPLKNLDALEKLNKENQIVVLLDQVSDPQNIGSILRSCAAFGVDALIIPERFNLKENATLAKVASGSLELVQRIVVGNLNQTIKSLQSLGFWTVAFSEEAKDPLHKINLKGKVALVVGSEGDGVRRLINENCDFHAHLPSSDFSTLNVATATAIALYQTYLVQKTG
ncbi:MAG: 23S rRNA (guanosine(2251)-2'-O)-methyltransferase RlmB [Proteobacteria bacterium]|nr:23S rRNA (guanosine(2251)-2'-O)-methyltransferase RlmB [Pseudomonadota bacterium]